MSMLSAQCDELREKAKLLRGHADGLKAPYVIPSTKELMMLTMLDSATRMEGAADTIEELRDRLQNQAFALGMQDALGSRTCEIEYVNDWMGWHCKSCDTLWQGLPDQKPSYCMRCGKAVKR